MLSKSKPKRTFEQNSKAKENMTSQTWACKQSEQQSWAASGSLSLFLLWQTKPEVSVALGHKLHSFPAHLTCPVRAWAVGGRLAAPASDWIRVPTFCVPGDDTSIGCGGLNIYLEPQNKTFLANLVFEGKPT